MGLRDKSAVAIQGEEGSNSARAARQLLGPDIVFLSCSSFQEVFSVLDDGRAPLAVLPFENSTAGLVTDVVDRVLQLVPGPPLCGKQETQVAISFVAAALPGAGAQVRRLLTHPVAAAQCRAWIHRAGLEVLHASDTAGAARLVKEQRDPTVAALCPQEAAALHGLEIIATGCNDAARTVTRFFLVESGDVRPQARDDARLLLLRPAASGLAQAAALLPKAGPLLRAVHSRPVPGVPGTYVFLIELAGADVAAAVDDLLGAARAQDLGARVVASMRAAPSFGISTG